MSDLVGNPEDRFSNHEAHINVYVSRLNDSVRVESFFSAIDYSFLYEGDSSSSKLRCFIVTVPGHFI